MSIPLSKERGIDPHMMYCPRCGKENGLTIGVIVTAEDSQGRTHYTNRGKTSSYNANLRKAGLEPLIGWKELKDPRAKIPGDICEECTTEIALFEKELKAGGVYFKCKSCDQAGMIKGNTELAQNVREHLNTPAPEPCGVEFKTCDQHGVEK